jgi:hypothetical protein
VEAKVAEAKVNLFLTAGVSMYSKMQLWAGDVGHGEDLTMAQGVSQGLCLRLCALLLVSMVLLAFVLICLPHAPNF